LRLPTCVATGQTLPLSAASHSPFAVPSTRLLRSSPRLHVHQTLLP
jgi:hypothetical protein